MGELKDSCLGEEERTPGYAQNGKFFSARIGAVRKAVKSCAELAFVDAPFAATGAFLGEVSADDERGAPLGWWNTGDGERPAKSVSYVGLAESVAQIRTLAATEGPFDGVLGFSQGSALAALVCLTARTNATASLLYATHGSS